MTDISLHYRSEVPLTATIAPANAKSSPRSITA